LAESSDRVNARGVSVKTARCAAETPRSASAVRPPRAPTPDARTSGDACATIAGKCSAATDVHSATEPSSGNANAFAETRFFRFSRSVAERAEPRRPDAVPSVSVATKPSILSSSPADAESAAAAPPPPAASRYSDRNRAEACAARSFSKDSAAFWSAFFENIAPGSAARTRASRQCAATAAACVAAAARSAPNASQRTATATVVSPAKDARPGMITRRSRARSSSNVLSSERSSVPGTATDPSASRKRAGAPSAPSVAASAESSATAAVAVSESSADVFDVMPETRLDTLRHAASAASGSRFRGSRAKGAASANAANALQALGTHASAGSAATASVSAPCVATARSPRVEDRDAKLTRLAARPVFASSFNSAAERYCREAAESRSCATAAAAAARARGDGS